MMRPLAAAAVVAVACGPSLVAIAPEAAPRPVTGPVYLYPRGALIAPGTSTGETWDGVGTLPPEVRRGLHAGLDVALRRNVMRRWLGGGVGAALSAAAAIVPWAADTLTSQTAAPDVRLVLHLNGRAVANTPRAARNTFMPTWSTRFPAVTVARGAVLDIGATDRDVLFDDHIGACHLRGPLMITARGYIAPDLFDCHGGLWGVLVEVQEQAPGL